MSEKVRFASIKMMTYLQDLELSPKELSDAIALALCGTLTASYKAYERGVEEKKCDAVDGMTWEEFIRLTTENIKFKCDEMWKQINEKKADFRV